MRSLAIAFSTFPDRQQARPARARGFTLIELIITILILAILLSLAAPGLSELIQGQRTKSAAFDVYAALIFARSEAIKRNSDVSICAGAGADWANGLTVKTTTCADPAAVTIKTQDALAGLSVTQKDNSAIGDVTYRRDGRLTAAPPLIVVKSSEAPTKVPPRCVSVDLSGQPNIKADTKEADGTYNPANGC